MKTYLNKFIGIFFLAALVLVGCEEEDNLNIVQPEAAFLLEQSSSSSILLNFGLPDNPAFTVTWTDDVTGSASYDVEMAIDDTFTNPIALGSSTSNSFSISVMDLNDAINATGTTVYDGLSVFVRVLAGNMMSNAVSYSVTAYPNEGPMFTSPSNGESFLLSLDTSDEVVMTVDFTDALPNDIGVANYTIEAALAGTDFAQSIVVGSISGIDTLELTHSDLNGVALALGLIADEAGDVDMRIVASNTSSNGTELERVGDIITVSITPYSVSFPFLYLVGDATTPGWNNNNSNTVVFRNQDVPNNYVYTGYFNVGAFKMLEVLGQWQPQWGTNDGSTLANSNSGSDPGTFNVATAGFYTYDFTVVGDGGSFTVTSFDASAAPLYNSIGFIGEAIGGWGDGDEIELTQDVNNPHLWYAFGVTFTNGAEFLIRPNDDWGNGVWRYTGSEELYGQANLAGGGDNFPFTGPSGSYDIWFNDLDGRYAIIPN